MLLLAMTILLCIVGVFTVHASAKRTYEFGRPAKRRGSNLGNAPVHVNVRRQLSQVSDERSRDFLMKNRNGSTLLRRLESVSESYSYSYTFWTTQDELDDVETPMGKIGDDTPKAIDNQADYTDEESDSYMKSKAGSDSESYTLNAMRLESSDGRRGVGTATIGFVVAAGMTLVVSSVAVVIYAVLGRRERTSDVA